MILLMWLVFIVLNGRWTLEIALIGLALALLVFAFMCAFLDWSLAREGRAMARLPKLVALAAALVWEIFKANIATLKRVWSRRPPESRIVTLKPGMKTRGQVQLLANAITLTPGTISLECDEQHIAVHCLDREMAEGLEDWPMQARIRGLEGDR